MTRLHKLLGMVFRFLLVWAVDAVSLMITAFLLPGIDLVARQGQSRLAVAASAALRLGLVNLLIRPIILLVARPFGRVVTFVVGFFVNMFDGDAEKSMLTLASMRANTPEEDKRRAEDVYPLMLNPYFFTRNLVLFLGEAARDVWQAVRQKQTGVWPRLNRLKGGYPFKRAATTVLLRDVAHSLVILDMMRGSPSIYTTFVGYDKVAHFSGPWSNDAFGVLKR